MFYKEKTTFYPLKEEPLYSNLLRGGIVIISNEEASVK